MSLQTQAATVIAHPSVALDELTHSQLRRIYSMRQTVWPNGASITVFVLNKSHKVHQDFCKKTLKMFPYQLESIWDKLTYSGVGNRPNEVNSLEELLEGVKSTPNAIGYVQEIEDATSIKVIQIVK